MVNSPIPVHRRRYSNEFKKQLRENFKEEKEIFDKKKSRFSEELLFMKSENGTIYTAIDSTSDEEVILKTFSPRNMMKLTTGEDVPSEIYFHLLAYKTCPENVVKPLDYYKESDGSFTLAMEKPKGYLDLLEVSRSYAPIDERSSFIVTKQLAEINQSLLNADIVHGDIKLENVLMNLKTLNLKLIDFGSAMDRKSIEERSKVPMGTSQYMPPEYHFKKQYKIEEASVWAIGAIMYVLLVGEWGFDEFDNEFTRVAESEEHLTSTALFLIGQTLNEKSHIRISIQGLLKMLNKIDLS